MGTIGSTQGERNESTPAEKAMNGPPAPLSVSRGLTSTPPTVKTRNGAASSAAKAK